MKLLIAEDQSMLRDAMAKLLLMEDRVDEVFQAENGKVAMDLILKHQCSHLGYRNARSYRFRYIRIYKRKKY